MSGKVTLKLAFYSVERDGYFCATIHTVYLNLSLKDGVL